jgi:hypothetical protein
VQPRTGHVAPDETRDPSNYVAHIEGPRSVVDRPDGPFASVEAAVEWARARAPVVYVRLRGESFRRSAGREQPATEPDMPPWPPDQSR